MATATAPWYTYPRVDAYGTPDTFGGFPKPDSNVEVPDGYPITALLSGVVTGINSPDGSVPAWGAAITIKLDQPINSLATHTAYIHLSSIASGLAVGSRVNAGDVIGYSGGARAAGTQKVPIGFALYAGDIYGYGPQWSQDLGNASLNPTSVLDAAKNGNLTVNTGGGSGLAGVANSLINLSPITNWISSLGPLWAWLQNPLRAVKLIAGILMLLVSLLLLITPGDTIEEKAAWIARLFV